MRTVRAQAHRLGAGGELFVRIAVTLLHTLLLALPVMWLSAFLAEQGWAVTPLSYWASYLTAFLFSWIIDGSGTVRRALDKD